MIAIPNPIKLRKDLPSGTIVLNRHESRNALSRDMVAQLQQAFEDFAGEKQVKAIILTGSGSTFCSGSDLKEIKESAEQPDAIEQWKRDVDQLYLLIETMLRFPKPIIAAINGPVSGSGAALLLAADIAIGGESAAVSFPEAKRGLVSGLAAPLLAFRIGAGQAANLLLSGRSLDAPASAQLGLLHELVQDDLVWAKAQQTATEIAAGSHQSLLLTKQLITETLGETLFTQLSIGAAMTASARTTEAAQEGVDAFVEKRSPDFDRG